MRSVKTD